MPVSPAKGGIKLKRIWSTPKTLILETQHEPYVVKLKTHTGHIEGQLIVGAPRNKMEQV